MQLIQKYQKLIEENQDQKEYFLKMWVTKDALNGYNIHIRLYTEFVKDLEDIQLQYNKLDFDQSKFGTLHWLLTKYKKFLSWFTAEFWRRQSAWSKLEFLEDAVMKANDLKNNTDQGKGS